MLLYRATCQPVAWGTLVTAFWANAAQSRSVLLEIPRESVENLTLSRFRDKYVNKWKPVVLQYADAQRRWRAVREWDEEYLAEKCPEAETKAQRYTDSFEWAGFDAVDRRMSFKELFQSWREHNSSSDVVPLYGFDFHIKCECPELFEDFELLKYFLANPLLENRYTFSYYWPVLLMGPPGTLSGIHVDNSFTPFWLTMMQGRKRVRVITYHDWNEHLSDFFADGKPRRKIPIFDDAFLERTPEFSRVTVWTADLAPGDTVYIPVAAGHAALNLESPDSKPAIAVTSNFLDERHEKQVTKAYCKSYEERTHLNNVLESAMCLQLMGVIDGPLNDHRRRRRSPKDMSLATSPFLPTFLSADLCHKYARPGKCSKLREICDSNGFTWQSAGPCKHSGPQLDFNDRWDLDGDGYISKTEWQLQMIMTMAPEPNAISRPAFAPLREMVKERDGLFKSRDRNNDHRLSCAEFFHGMDEEL